MLKRIAIFLLAMLAGAVSASAQDAESALKQFEGKTLVLRHSLQSDSQEYDAKGKALKGANEGPWTVYSGVLVDRIAVTPETLRVEGKRIFFLFPENGLVLYQFHKLKDESKPPPPSPFVKVEIQLERPTDSPDQALAILGKVFALTTKDLLASLPDVWRAYVADHLVSYDASQKSDAEFHWRKERGAHSEAVSDTTRDLASGYEGSDKDKSIFHIGKDDDVKRPQAKFTPGPEYSALAQYEKYQGIVIVAIIVGKDGKVYHPRLLHPLGMGLDEIALSTVQTWRFQPSTHKGEPVAVEMNIEVTFNLY